MITQTLSLMAALYDAIGPGFVLVLALPFLLVALVIVIRVSLKRLATTE